MDYMKIDLTKVVGGLDHQTFNFKHIIKYSYINKLKLIKPIIRLERQHTFDNKEKISDLSEYYDLDNIKVNKNKVEIYEDNEELEYTIKNKNYKWSLLRMDEMFKLSINDVNIPPSINVIETTKKILLMMEKNYMCIHVRRGDLVKNNQIDMDTQPENIKKVIKRYNPKSVYIMTNRINEIKSLSEIEGIKFYTDFEILREIKDNYFLYSIEKQIMRNAKIRCSTFNTGIPYFHCYLTNHVKFPNVKKVT